MIWLAIGIVLFCGILNRVRGGLWGPAIDGGIAAVDGGKKPGTQLARAIFAVGMDGALTLWTHEFWMLLSIPLWFIDEFLPNGDYLGAVNLWQDLEATGVGIGNVLLVGALMWALSYFHLYSGLWWAIIVAGALKGVVYLVANRLPFGIGNGWGFNQGAEMAELLFGLVLGAGIVGSAV